MSSPVVICGVLEDLSQEQAESSFKTCFRCKEQKLLTDYYTRVSRGKSIPSTYCKACNSLVSKERSARLNAANPDYKPNAVPVIDGKRMCANCRTPKPIEEFGRVSGRKNGTYTTLRPYCNPCRVILARTSREKLTEEQKQIKKQRRRVSRLLKTFGLTPEMYKNILDIQGPYCAICKSHSPDTFKLAVDHNHTTGKVRGLLCIQCNTSLGLFKEDPSIFRAALDYLESDGVV